MKKHDHRRIETIVASMISICCGIFAGIAISANWPIDTEFDLPGWVPGGTVPMTLLFGAVGFVLFLLIQAISAVTRWNVTQNTVVMSAISILFFILVLCILPKKPVSTEHPTGEENTTTLKEILAGSVVKNRLNIILFTFDTTRADHIGCYGKTDTNTPTLDRLARSGVMFRRTFSTHNSTSPSHASILTSLHIKEHGVIDNRHHLHYRNHTLAEVLRSLDYRTAGFTSTFFLNPSISGLHQGFEHFEFPEQTAHLRASEVNAKVLKWFDNYRKEKEANSKINPFFTWIHYFDPHNLYDPPEEFRNLYYVGNAYDPTKHDFERIPTYHKLRSEYRGITDLNYIHNLYKGEITYADRSMGELLDQLEKWHLIENTIIVITADHGENMGEHSLFYNHAGLYQTTINVPLIMHGPRELPCGKTIDAIVSSIDIFPTLLDLLGISPPAFLRGRSLLPLIEGKTKSVHHYIFAQDNISNFCATDGKWKLIYPDSEETVRGFTHTHRELYDLEIDPGEEKNLVYEKKTKVDELLKIASEWAKAHTSNIAPCRSGMSRENVNRLKSLGYLN